LSVKVSQIIIQEIIDEIEQRYNIVASNQLNVFWVSELTNEKEK
jgi:hypothetical protein